MRSPTYKRFFPEPKSPAKTLWRRRRDHSSVSSSSSPSSARETVVVVVVLEQQVRKQQQQDFEIELTGTYEEFISFC